MNGCEILGLLNKLYDHSEGRDFKVKVITSFGKDDSVSILSYSRFNKPVVCISTYDPGFLECAHHFDRSEEQKMKLVIPDIQPAYFQYDEKQKPRDTYRHGQKGGSKQRKPFIK